MDTVSTDAGERTELTEAILDLYDDFSARLITGQQAFWFSVDLTLPQIKVVMLVVTRGQMTGSQLARGLGISLPSTTRFVDRLVECGLLVREDDPLDRRVTNIAPTPAACRLIESLNDYRREYLSALLATLDPRQLHEVQRALTHLVSAPPPGGAERGEIEEAETRGR